MTGERFSSSPEHGAAEIAQTLDGAQKSLYQLTADPRFQGTCMDREIDPYDDMGEPKYWDTVADYAHGVAERGRQAGADPLRLSAFELVSSTPSAVLETISHDRASAAGNSKNFTVSRRLRTFNGMLRAFGEEFPEADVEDVSSAMLGSANMAIEDPVVRRAAPDAVRSIVRGAMHEVGFGQILEHTGRTFTPATESDDRHGFDYTVEGDSGRELRVDVKASLKQIEREGAAHSPYAVRSDGIINMYSLTKDEEFQGKFTLPDDVAASKAPILDELLSHAEAGRKIS